MKLTELKSKVFLLEALGEILFPPLFQIVKVTCDFCLLTLSSIFSVSSSDLSPAAPCSLSSSLHLLLWLFLGPLWLHWVYLDNSGWNHLSVLNLNTPESLFLPWKVTYLQIPGIGTWISLRAIIILTSGFVIKIVNCT